MKMLRAVLRARWNALRLVLALFILWSLAADSPARLARVQLACLPDADYANEVRDLREHGRYAEALVVADAGLAAAKPAQHAEIATERAATLARQQSLLRRLKDLARGAVLGGPSNEPNAPDASLELLLGAVATDLFVVGDIRDLVIQGGRWMRGDQTDPVIAALAGIGIVTTLAPEIDWAPSLLKAARKAGAMTERFAQFIMLAAKERRVDALRAVMNDTGAIARAASPAGALRILRRVESAEDAARLARFLERTGAGGARALSLTGKDGIELAKGAETLRAAGRISEAAAAERVLMQVSGKGRAGAAWLAKGFARPLLKPHPLIGIAKSIWKGNAQALVARALESIDPFATWALPAAAAWVFIEMCLLLRRFVPARPVPNLAQVRLSGNR